MRYLSIAVVLLAGCVFDRGGASIAPSADLSPDMARLDLHVVVDGTPDALADAPVPDRPAPDLPLADVATAELPLLDLPPPDAPAPDVAPDLPLPDLPAPDLPPPDAPPPDQKFVLGDAMTDAAIAFCAAKYGAAPGYILCWVTPSGCAFNANTNNNDCNAMCQGLGGTCVAAWDNPNSSGQECNPYAKEPCSTDRGTEICLCSK